MVAVVIFIPLLCISVAYNYQPSFVKHMVAQKGHVSYFRLEKEILNYINMTVYGLHSNFNPDWVSFKKFDKCKSKCRLVRSNWASWKQSKVVLFHGMTLPKIPPPKPQGQIWVLYLHEAPTIAPMFKIWKGLFNLTMTYRRDSDIYDPYAGFRKTNRTPLLRGKQFNSSDWDIRKMALWLVSNCHTHSKRELYARQLKKISDVHVFGKCAVEPQECPRHNMTDCLYISKQYKFYFSFENSLCRDYVTEKAFKVYREGENSHLYIPVVRADYTVNLILPPDSYIDTSRYGASVEQLAMKMNNMSSIKASKYFKWKYTYKVKSEDEPEFYYCSLCDRLRQGDKYYNRVYDNIDVWFRGNEKNSICYEATDLESKKISKRQRALSKLFKEARYTAHTFASIR